MRWYICKSRGRLIVEPQEPHPTAYVQGPFTSVEDAFGRLREMMTKRHAREKAVDTLLFLVFLWAVSAVALWVM